MHRQQGAGLIGALLFLMPLGLVLYTGFQIASPLSQHWVVERAMKNALLAGADANETELRTRFERDLALNGVTSVTSRNLVVDRDARGYRLTVVYSVKKPLFGPVSLCLDFDSSQPAR